MIHFSDNNKSEQIIFRKKNIFSVLVVESIVKVVENNKKKKYFDSLKEDNFLINSKLTIKKLLAF